MKPDQDEPELPSDSLQALKKRRKEKMQQDLLHFLDDPRISPEEHEKADKVGKGLTKPVK